MISKLIPAAQAETGAPAYTETAGQAWSERHAAKAAAGDKCTVQDAAALQKFQRLKKELQLHKKSVPYSEW